MAHTVDLPNGEQAEFPDEMSPDQISSVIQKQFPPTNASPQQSGSVNTFLGQMQRPNVREMITDPKMINEMVRSYGVGAPNNLINLGSEASNILKNLPISSMAKKAFDIAKYPAKGALIGAAYNEDHPVIGGIIGAGMGSIPAGLQISKKLINLGKNALSRIPYETIGKEYQTGHDVLKKSAEDIFKKIGSEVKVKEIPEFEVSPRLIKQISTYMPKTSASKKLIQNSKEGDYSSLRKLQTQLFKYGTKGIKSDIPTENIKGEEILDLRNRVNNSIFKHLTNTGNPDLAKSLKNGMNQYKNLQDTYYARKLSSSLKDMVHEDSRLIPKNIGELLDVKSVPTDRIFEHNPGVLELVGKYSKNKNALKSLKNLGIGIGGAGIIGGLTSFPGAVGKIRDAFND